jgi:hypothetical protein
MRVTTDLTSYRVSSKGPVRFAFDDDWEFLVSDSFRFILKFKFRFDSVCGQKLQKILNHDESHHHPDLC